MRAEFTGMLRGAIIKFEQLLEAVPGSRVTRGFDPSGGPDDLRTWGVVCSIEGDMDALKAAAQSLGIDWLGGNDFACTNGLTVDDFKTYRVTGDLQVAEEGGMI